MKPIRSCAKLLILLMIFSGVYVYRQFSKVQIPDVTQIEIQVEAGESVAALAEKLEAEGVVRSAEWFKRYLQFKGLDKKIHAGDFSISGPITLESIVSALTQETQKEEIEITILPGWDNRQVATYLSEQGIGTEDAIISLIGESAVDHRIDPQRVIDVKDYDVTNDVPKGASLEGYLAPNTYRVFADAGAEAVIQKLLGQRERELTDDMRQAIKRSGRSLHEVIIVASLLEREVRSASDKAIVADLFWRRLDNDWPLQADSTVHYLTGTDGSVFTSAADRETDSPYNTYKYPGLPLGPIAHPSIESIEAAIYPEANGYWYFLTTLDTGEVKYGRSLDEHNANVARYLR